MDWVDQRLAEYRGRIAGFESGRSWTYEAFSSKVDHLARELNSFAGSEIRVIVIYLDSILESFAALFAVRQAGHIAMPLSIEMSAAERTERQQLTGASFALNANGIQALSKPKRMPKLIHKLAERAHAGLILFSSGTSGEPKGMLHDLDELFKRYRRVKPRADRTLQLLLAEHIGGLDSAFRTLFSGSTLIVPEKRTPSSVARAIERHKANVLPASPTFLNLMLMTGVSTDFDCSSLEVIAYGAEPMPRPLLERLIATFPNARFQQKFGTSETGAIRIKSQSDDSVHFRIKDSDVEWQILDGELWLKTDSRILGYLNADDTPLQADGWYRTGDLVEAVDEGQLRIIGRCSAVINVGGRKVHPGEIEQLIMGIEGVTACAVYAKPDVITGSVIACKIITVQRADDLRGWKRKIRVHCRRRIADWKIPVFVELDSKLSVTDQLKLHTGSTEAV